jgi:acyl dehydratase
MTRPTGFEFSSGIEVVSPGRTITEADVVAFAGLTGDYAELHTNAELMAESEFGERIAHGMLGMSIQLGLATRVMPSYGGVAFLGISDWRFLRPVLIGDTVRARVQVTGIRDSRSRPGHEVVTLRRDLVNQRDEITQTGTTISLARKRTGSTSD